MVYLIPQWSLMLHEQDGTNDDYNDNNMIPIIIIILYIEFAMKLLKLHSSYNYIVYSLLSNLTISLNRYFLSLYLKTFLLYIDFKTLGNKFHDFVALKENVLRP